MAQAEGAAPAPAAARRGRQGPRQLRQPVRPQAQLQRDVRRRDPVAAAQVRRDRQRLPARQDRGVHAGGAVPDVWRRPPAPPPAARPRRRPVDRRRQRPVDPRIPQLLRQPRAQRAGHDDRRAGAERDQRTAEVPPRRGP